MLIEIFNQVTGALPWQQYAVTQTIYSASLIAEVLPQVWARSPEEGTRNLTKLRQLVRGALAEMRTLLFELRPSALENARLDILLPQLADAFTGRTRVPVAVDLDVNGRSQLPPEVKIALYRMTQEAFNNIAKHASATAVTLSLKQQSDDVRLSIKDNGHGFDPKSTSAENMGLQIMRERAAAIHAHVEMISAANKGTHLQIIWPAEQSVPYGETQ